MVSRPAPVTGRIDGERLYLRPLTSADCGPDYVGWLQDPDVYRYLETRHRAQTAETIRAFVEAVNAKPDEHLFGIFQRVGDRHIGNIKIGPMGSVHPIADITLLLGERAIWGQGYGSEAILTASRYAMRSLGMRKLTASMYASNQGSYRAFLKAGFQHEGLRRNHLLLDGAMVDMLEVGMAEGDLA